MPALAIPPRATSAQPTAASQPASGHRESVPAAGYIAYFGDDVLRESVRVEGGGHSPDRRALSPGHQPLLGCHPAAHHR